MTTKASAYEKILQNAFEERERAAKIVKFPVQYDKEQLRRRLTLQQYHVTQDCGTERPFSGQLPHCSVLNGIKGADSNGSASSAQVQKTIYSCVVCSNDLFSSADKFDSGCGWPAFTRPINDQAVVYFKDASYNMVRVETVCAKCGAHLGHIFEDGPPPLRTRYCINSISLINKSEENAPGKI